MPLATSQGHLPFLKTKPPYAILSFMSKKRTSPNYTKILNVLYIVISLAVMVTFIFASTPRSEEYLGIFGVTSWGAILAAFTAIALAVSAMLQAKK